MNTMHRILSEIALKFDKQASQVIYMPIGANGKFKLFFCLGNEDEYNSAPYILKNHPDAYAVTMDDAKRLSQLSDCLNSDDTRFTMSRIEALRSTPS